MVLQMVLRLLSEQFPVSLPALSVFPVSFLLSSSLSQMLPLIYFLVIICWQLDRVSGFGVSFAISAVRTSSFTVPIDLLFTKRFRILSLPMLSLDAFIQSSLLYQFYLLLSDQMVLSELLYLLPASDLVSALLSSSLSDAFF